MENYAFDFEMGFNAGWAEKYPTFERNQMPCVFNILLEWRCEEMSRALVGVETLFMVSAHDVIAFSRHQAGVKNLFEVPTDSRVCSEIHQK
jgi:hypothetical protein